MTVENRDEMIPDPVALLRRISVLEQSLKRIRSDSVGIAHRKKALVPSLVELQLENARILQEVGTRCYQHEHVDPI